MPSKFENSHNTPQQNGFRETTNDCIMRIRKIVVAYVVYVEGKMATLALHREGHFPRPQVG